MKILFFGNYAANYSRTHVLLMGLSRNRISVVECNDNSENLVVRSLKLIYKFVTIKGQGADIILVGFPGHFDVPLAWILSKIYGKKVVFDAFISLYNSYILDRHYYSKNSWRAKVWFFVDWLDCKLADVVLLDTDVHIKYFVKTFHLPPGKFYRVLVGTDEKIFYPRRANRHSKFTVGFHGSYLPLQGVPIIIEAAKLVPGVLFRLLGEGPEYQKCRRLAEKMHLDNVEFLPPVSYNDLPNFINSNDVYLGGPFGSNEKAGLVIPNKVYEAIAMKKATVVGDSTATRELFKNGIHCLFVKQGDYKSLAGAIVRLKTNKMFREKIAKGGYNLLVKRLTPKVIIAKFLFTFRKHEHNS